MPEVETGHHVQADIFLASGWALQTAVDSFPPLVAHAAQRTGALGDVVFEEVGPRVAAFPQVGSGHVRHAGRFLVVVGHHVVHVGVGVGELLERSIICAGLGLKHKHTKRRLCICYVVEDGDIPALKGFP